MEKQESAVVNRLARMATKALVCLLAGLAMPMAAAAAPPDPPAPVPAEAPVPGKLLQQARSKGGARVIVRLASIEAKAEGALASAAEVTTQRGLIQAGQQAILDRLPARAASKAKRYQHVPYLALEVDAAELEALLADPRVAAVYEDRPLAAFLAESAPLVGAPTAWAQGRTGSGQVVAVLDTGVDKTHGFLIGKVAHEACFSTTSAIAGTTTACPNGASTQVGPGAAPPCRRQGCEHGTHVAGIAAGTGPSFSGIARGASIMAVQVFSQLPGDTVAFTSDIIAALEHVYQQRNAFRIAAVNLSLGGGRFTAPCDSEPMKAPIDLLRSAGIATVVASGNDSYTDALSSPACISSAISVGSTTKSDVVSSFSNSAQFLDLLAPGSSIQSSVPGGGFAFFNGTSMAAPHVAGAIAVIRSAAAAAAVDQIQSALALTGAQVLDERNGITKRRIRVDQALGAINAPGGTLTVSPRDGLDASGPQGGPFTPASRGYTLTNTGSAPISFAVNENVPWLEASPTGGTLTPGQARQVIVSVSVGANGLAPDNYFAAVEMANTPNGAGGVTVSATLTVTNPAIANDKLEDAIALPQSAGSTAGINVGATKEPGEPNHAGISGGKSVWWRWTAPTAGRVRFSTTGSSFDTLLAAYTGSRVDALTPVASNDDQVPDFVLQIAITFAVQGGVTYQVAVDGYRGASGSIALDWEFTAGEVPAPDLAVSPTGGLVASGPQGGPFVPGSKTYTLTNVSSASTSYQVRGLPGWVTATPGSGSLPPAQSVNVVLSVNPAANGLAAGQYNAEALFNGIARALQLTVTGGGVPNDPFASATALSAPSASVIGSNVNATREPGEPTHAGNIGGRSVWWRWTAGATATVTIDTFGSGFDTTLGVYTGTNVAALRTVASNDDAGGALQSAVSFQATAGSTYSIAVDGYNGASGAINLNVTSGSAGTGPPNDAFSSATVLSGPPATVTASNINATRELGEPNHGGNIGGRSVWWRWTAGVDGTVDIDTFGSAFDTTLGVYTGTNVAALGTVASNDDAGGTLQSAVRFQAVAGTAYRIAVDGYEGRAGFIRLTIRGAAGLVRTLTVGVTGSGAVASAPTGINCPGDCSQSYAAGTPVTLSVTAATDWEFRQWSGACVGAGPCVLDMEVDRSVTAQFAPADTDGDGVANLRDNCPLAPNPTQGDLDRDGQGDACDSDRDGDGMPNTYEVANGLNPDSADDANRDADTDGLSNRREYDTGTDPHNPDTDGDRARDGSDPAPLDRRIGPAALPNWGAWRSILPR